MKTRDLDGITRGRSRDLDGKRNDTPEKILALPDGLLPLDPQD